MIFKVEGNKNHKFRLPKVLYHATLGSNLEKIKADGAIIPGIGKKNYKFSRDDSICLDADYNEAGCFVSGSGIPDEEEIYVLSIDSTKLDKEYLKQDRNVFTWKDTEEGKWWGVSFEYFKEIPLSSVIDIKKF